eukprot:scaffold16213_cov58-Phaeocystis_antarctica.AAC.2
MQGRPSAACGHLVAQARPELEARCEGLDEGEPRLDVVRREERLPQPLAHEAAAHGRLAVREDAEQRGVLVRLPRHRVDRERTHRPRVETHVVRRVDPLDGPLAVALGAAHELQVLDEAAAGRERQLLRALEAAAVQLRLAEEALQVLLRILGAEAALARLRERHLAQLHHLGELRHLGRLQLGGQQALLGALLADEGLER